MTFDDFLSTDGLPCVVCGLPVDTDDAHMLHTCGGAETCDCDEVAHPGCCPDCQEAVRWDNQPRGGVMDANDVDPRLTAAVDLLHRAGATVFQIRYSDDEPPVVWIAVAGWVGPDGIVWQTGSSVDPVEAVMCLCETVVDGATCVHCGKTTSFIAGDKGEVVDHDASAISTVRVSSFIAFAP